MVLFAGVILGGVWLVKAVAAGSGADGAEAAAGTAATTGPDAKGTDGAPAVPVGCAPADLQLAVVADAAAYAAGANPVLQVSVTNIGAVPCTVDAGDVAREVVVSSGTDRIWSTKDCASADTASRQLLLAAGARDTKDITWGRVRSAESCPANLPAPRAGTYQVVATLLGSSAPAVAFNLQ